MTLKVTFYLVFHAGDVALLAPIHRGGKTAGISEAVGFCRRFLIHQKAVHLFGKLGACLKENHVTHSNEEYLMIYFTLPMRAGIVH